MASVLGTVSYVLTSFGLLRPYAPILDILPGKVQGVVSTSRNGRHFYAYLGIPYAQPPVKLLRFESPVPLSKWHGTYKAYHYGPDCAQVDTVAFGNIIGSEDCLYLNVFTPKIDARNPVLVYIHGGGPFTSGTSRLYDPKYFEDENLVVVTLNYRLYSLGFLNTGDGKIKGNMGLKDQNLALRWIQENIKRFGGDPDQVTLMGHGSGGASVHFHILSPLSKGLFHRVVSQSGNAVMPWAFSTVDPVRQVISYGSKVNCAIYNMTALLFCLKRKSIDSLLLPARNLMAPVYAPEEAFLPSVEAVKREDTFIDENPFDTMLYGTFNKVPWLTGVTSNEGCLHVAKFESYHEILEQLQSNWSQLLPMVLNYDSTKISVTEKIQQYYFMEDSKLIDPKNDLEMLSKLFSESLYFHPTEHAALLHGLYAQVYLYYMKYESKNLPSPYGMYRSLNANNWITSHLTGSWRVLSDMIRNKKNTGHGDWGVCHGQDILLLWNVSPVSEIWSVDPDYEFSKAMIQAMIDFVKGRRMSFRGSLWPSTNFSNSAVLYMSLDEKTKVIDSPFKQYLKFWDSLNIRIWN